MAAVRIICEPTECWVQPRAYMMVRVRSGTEVVAMHLAHLEEGLLGRAADVAHHLRRVAGSSAVLSSCSTQRGCCRVGSTLA